MRLSIQDFVTKYQGRSVDFDKKFGAQCVDLFNFYNSEVVGAPFIGTPTTGGARDLYETDSPVRAEFYKRLPANSQLQAGDVQVYGAPQGRAVVDGQQIFYGHVNIYIGDGKVIQQNAKWNQLTTVDENFTAGLLGILRPIAFIGENSPQDVSQPTKNKNKHVIEPGDTFWALENKYGWKHGTLEALNPGIDPRALTIGRDIITPEQPTASPAAAETYYTIARGDTFWGLENAWQLPHGTLQKLNPGVEPKKLAIGQRIRRS